MKFPLASCDYGTNFCPHKLFINQFHDACHGATENFLGKRQRTAIGNYNLKWQQKKFNVQGGSEEFYLLQLVNFQTKKIIFSLFD